MTQEANAPTEGKGLQDFVLVATAILIVRLFDAVYSTLRAFVAVAAQDSSDYLTTVPAALLRATFLASGQESQPYADALVLPIAMLVVFIHFFWEVRGNRRWYAGPFAMLALAYDIGIMFLFVSFAHSVANLNTKSVLSEDTAWYIGLAIYMLLALRLVMARALDSRFAPSAPKVENADVHALHVQPVETRRFWIAALWYTCGGCMLFLGARRPAYVLDVRLLYHDLRWLCFVLSLTLLGVVLLVQSASRERAVSRNRVVMLWVAVIVSLISATMLASAREAVIRYLVRKRLPVTIGSVHLLTTLLMGALMTLASRHVRVQNPLRTLADWWGMVYGRFLDLVAPDAVKVGSQSEDPESDLK
ncbi:MAG: hypothetical protein ACKVU1_02590 [bacterium]